MPGLLDRFTKALNSPQTAMAAGLLSPTPQGSFGGGLLQAVQAGNAQQQALQELELMRAREMYLRQQALTGGQAPMSVKEFQFYNSLKTQEEKDTFMQLKRDQWRNLGGGYGQFGAGGGVSNFVPKTLAPGEQPEVKGAQAEQAALGTGRGKLATEPAVTAANTKARLEAERSVSMAGLADIFDEAEAILTGEVAPTGSGVGAAVDYAGGLVGYSPKGSVEAAKLKAIGASLITKMPRMEGPQSDRDARLYREQAAMVGDSTIPVEQRIGALESARGIASRYLKKPSGTFDDDKERRYQEWKAKQ